MGDVVLELQLHPTGHGNVSHLPYKLLPFRYLRGRLPGANISSIRVSYTASVPLRGMHEPVESKGSNEIYIYVYLYL